MVTSTEEIFITDLNAVICIPIGNYYLSGHMKAEHIAKILREFRDAVHTCCACVELEQTCEYLCTECLEQKRVCDTCASR